VGRRRTRRRRRRRRRKFTATIKSPHLNSDHHFSATFIYFPTACPRPRGAQRQMLSVGHMFTSNMAKQGKSTLRRTDRRERTPKTLERI